MFRKYLITLWLPVIVDTAINVLFEMSQKSDNTIDDTVADMLRLNRDAFIEEIKRAL